jgi:ABC-type uncharacterized transport system ATPase subunit
VDEIPERTDVIRQLFRERERLADEPTAALAKSVVEAFNVIGLAGLSLPTGR